MTTNVYIILTCLNCEAAYLMWSILVQHICGVTTEPSFRSLKHFPAGWCKSDYCVGRIVYNLLYAINNWCPDLIFESSFESFDSYSFKGW